jgi:hypothetical protein
MKKLTTDEFIERAKAVHGDTYDYSKVHYVDMHTNVEIICRKHGSFFQLPCNHVRGWGCGICNKVEKRRLDVDEFIARSNAVHNNKYDYSKVQYTNTKTKVEIICPKHGSFMQKPEKHMIGAGCPKCRSNYADTKESFIEKARLVHGDLYDYSNINYVNSQTKICIMDKEYGEFWQTPNAHLNGEGHPSRKPERCYMTKMAHGTFNVSRQEEMAKSLLCDKFGEDDVLTQYRSREYPFSCDFYIISLDLYIELNIHITHGWHWFDSTDRNDLDRLELLKSRATGTNMYNKMINVWTNTDLKKRDTAIKNNLNYLVFWDEGLYDFLTWYNSFDDTHILKQF